MHSSWKITFFESIGCCLWHVYLGLGLPVTWPQQNDQQPRMRFNSRMFTRLPWHWQTESLLDMAVCGGNVIDQFLCPLFLCRLEVWQPSGHLLAGRASYREQKEPVGHYGTASIIGLRRSFANGSHWSQCAGNLVQEHNTVPGQKFSEDGDFHDRPKLGVIAWRNFYNLQTRAPFQQSQDRSDVGRE